MKVVVTPQALDGIKEFYQVALSLHVNLDESTVISKIERFLVELRQLGTFPHCYPKARYKKEWIKQGCRDFVHEDLHAAYKIVEDENGESYVLVVDVCHSKLYHD